MRTAFVVVGKWELWNFDIETLKGSNDPHPLRWFAREPLFEDGA